MKLAGFIGALLAVLCTGCANIHLYSEDRDKQGQALSKAWGEVDVPGYFKAMRTERAKLLAAEYDQISEHALARRNSYARLVVEHPVDANGAFGPAGLKTLLAADVKQVAGAAPLSDFHKAILSDIQLASAREEARFAASTLLVASKGVKVSCESLNAGNTPVFQDANSTTLLNDLVDQCKRIDKASDARSAALAALPSNSLLGIAAAQYDDFVADRKSKTDAVKATKDEVERASAAYKAAVGASKSDADKPSKIVSEKAGEVQAAVKQLVDARNAFADQALASTNVDKLNAILKSLKDGKSSADTGTIEELAALIPYLADDVRELQRTASLGPQASLQLRLQLEQAKLQRANARVALIDKRIVAANELVQIRTEHAFRLKSALDAFPAAGAGAALNKLLSGPPLSEAERIKVAGTSLVLLDAQVNHRAGAERKEVEILSLSHEQSIVESEANAEEYRILIASTVSQSAAYAASGVKAEDIAKIVNAVALVWIGNGVNK